ncbi:hypothetical protein HJG60_011552 [Phyllostomus discolor]|uniref:Uncharacterized protein n=1 Tax=Phyllostomus discolor TaxID=89673 RepID=A0A834E0W0_9CHIR|nr:hypothetical protein HJG60_011552 [Phyllostomus discolor]
MGPKMPRNAAQHKIVNLLKTFCFAPQFLLAFVYLTCGPRQLIFFQCGPEMPKGWTSQLLEKKTSFSRKSFLSQQKQQKDRRWERWKPEGTASPTVMGAQQRQKERQFTLLPEGKLKQYRDETLTEAEARFKDLHLSSIISQITNFGELEIVRDLSSE